MTKADLKILEKLFDAEIRGALPCQIKSNRLEQLEKDGLVEKVTITLPGRFPVKISGWALTIKGNMEYCASCDEPPQSKEAGRG